MAVMQSGGCIVAFVAGCLRPDDRSKWSDSEVLGDS